MRQYDRWDGVIVLAAFAVSFALLLPMPFNMAILIGGLFALLYAAWRERDRW